MMAFGWGPQIGFQPSLLLPFINVKCDELYTGNSVVAMLSHVCEAEATCGVGVLAMILQLQEKHAGKSWHKEQPRTRQPGLTANHLSPGAQVIGVTAPALRSLHFG